MATTNLSSLSRRERQIMESLYARGEATVLEIQKDLPKAPTPMAIRTMLKILEEKRLVRRKKNGREHIYFAAQTREKAGSTALRSVLDVFFQGSVEQALATHFSERESGLDHESAERLKRMIDEAKMEGL